MNTLDSTRSGLPRKTRSTLPRRRQPRRRLGAALLTLSCMLTGVTLPAPGLAATLQVTGSLWSPYLDDQLPEGGLAADLVRTALTRAGYDISVNVENWPRAYQGTAVGVYDVVAAIWETGERARTLMFSEPYLLNDIVFLARRDMVVDYATLADLIGLRIGVVREYAYDEAFDSDPNLTRVANNHLIQNLLLLRQGQLDMVVDDKWAILHQLSTFMPNDIGDFRLLPKPLARRALRIGVSRDNPEAPAIVAAFDTAMTAMREDGTYDEIVRKHTSGIAVLPAQR